MTFNPEIHRRRSIRLKDYDYSQAGAYFVTICAWNKDCIFGDVENAEIRMNECGQVVRNEWLHTENIRSNVELDAFIVMPNHVHGILVIVEGGRGVLQYAPSKKCGFSSPSQTLGSIIRGLKSSATKIINQIRNSHGVPVWQRNYYEHIIRNETELNKIREYIINNPLNWKTDENYRAD
jgi:putative transposase